MEQKIFLNGKMVTKDNAKVSVYDHGLLYGDGVFEGIRSYDRKVFKLEEHVNRLYESAGAIRLSIPGSKEEMQKNILETLKVNGLDNAYIRVIVTRGPGDLGLDPRKCSTQTVIIIVDKITLYPEELYKNGLPIVIAKTRRNHPATLDPRIKSLNYLNNILGKIDAIDGGTEEALMLNIEEDVAECTGDNIFIVKEDKLFTPPFGVGALEGVTQDTVISLAKKRGIETVQKKLFPQDIFEADECFLTGTAAEIIAVVKIDDKVIGAGEPGRMTKQLREDFQELTRTEGVPY